MSKNCLLFLFFSVVFLLLSCNDRKVTNKSDSEERGHAYDANAHMHQSSTKELINRFSDPTRDEWQLPERVIKKMQLSPEMTVLDLGAGSGYFTYRMAPLVEKVIAADVEDGFLTHVRKMADSLSLANIETMKIPLTGPDSLKTDPDRILIVNTYHHISDRIQYFERLHEQIAKNGRLFIVDFKKNINGSEIPGPPEKHKLSYLQVQKELNEASWQEIELDTISLPFQYIISAK